ncbi:CPBP family intramembrane glutamic endopeptidase [Aeribacillus pallidus]|uniref:CPBP family intramembrane glutamic endopeptidase n=1 Tax=Aeribacillus pallidus TaxID=33936 RepID=UPI003D1D30CA
MNKQYVLILITYLAMQFSSFIGIPLIYQIGVGIGVTESDMELLAPSYWIVFSFSITFVLTMIWIRRSERLTRLERETPADLSVTVLWAIIGVFMAFFAQLIAITIESFLGIEQGSENTEMIIQLIETFPLVVLVSSIFGPVLEEIVFRKIIFGTLYNRYSFFISALISSFIFAIAHMELEHLLLYAAMGFTFAFLYVQTKRIIVPIFAHVTMNTLVVLAQLFLER